MKNEQEKEGRGSLFKRTKGKMKEIDKKERKKYRKLVCALKLE